MPIKYWEFEDAPLKEKLKSPNIKEIAKVFFDNDTEAYRFSIILLEVKKKGQIKLKDVPAIIPIASAKRYLDFAVQTGLLKHENGYYSFTDRFTKPFRNIATYIKAWVDSTADEDITIEFPNAKTDKQQKRGGRKPIKIVDKSINEPSQAQAEVKAPEQVQPQ
ncbi:MAG: hypothetical protein M1538_01270 [Candidatus Marsarchaeota archaeon]|jgi:hypothetical protein|nr:hypothetical protein [Candidatus Marsarchaeota archaeon]